MCFVFALGFIFGMALEYFWHTHAPEISEQRRVEREAEDATAWDQS